MVTRAKDIKYIVVHCQAGTGTLESMQNYWKNNLKWKSPGYATWVDFDGTRQYLAPYDSITNGVAGFNKQCLHLSYRGGVENKGTAKNPIWKGKDTRTQAQKDAILKEILLMIQWLQENGNDLQNVMILGHYQFSTDQNKNGAIESWERIKECPSFDAYKEYAFLMQPLNPNYHNLKLPKNR